jgi:hypothetical protein
MEVSWLGSHCMHVDQMGFEWEQLLQMFGLSRWGSAIDGGYVIRELSRTASSPVSHATSPDATSLYERSAV